MEFHVMLHFLCGFWGEKQKKKTIYAGLLGGGPEWASQSDTNGEVTEECFTQQLCCVARYQSSSHFHILR